MFRLSENWLFAHVRCLKLVTSKINLWCYQNDVLSFFMAKCCSLLTEVHFIILCASLCSISYIAHKTLTCTLIIMILFKPAYTCRMCTVWLKQRCVVLLNVFVLPCSGRPAPGVLFWAMREIQCHGAGAAWPQSGGPLWPLWPHLLPQDSLNDCHSAGEFTPLPWPCFNIALYVCLWVF